MLSLGESLATWQFADGPQAARPDQATTCRRLADHRLEYLQYEGPVSGNRGSVKRIDDGKFKTVSREDDIWVFDAAGRLMAGRYELARAAAGQPDEWIFRKLPDQRGQSRT